MRFLDVEIPLSDVSIYTRNGIFIAKSSPDGYAHIPALFLKYSYLVAIRNDYKPDTIRRYHENIYLTPLNAVLQEAVVSSNSDQRVLRSSREYVVDYDFVGDNILVASYNGPFGRDAKLFLLDNYGDTLALQKLPEEPLALFKSCLGKYYCVCFSRFYPLTIDSGHIRIEAPYDIKFLPGLKACQLAMGGNLYYKISRPDLFEVTYGYMEQGDTVFHVFLQFHDSVAYRASREEDVLYYTEDERRKQSHKFDVGYARDLWDKTSFRVIDAHLFTKDDSILVFDYIKRQIRYFNLIGIEVKNSPFNFANDKNRGADIIKDELTDRFYLHALNNAAYQALNEIRLRSGDIDDHRVWTDKPFAQNIKVHNGNIYFLWQDSHHAGTRQLYIQKAF